MEIAQKINTKGLLFQWIIVNTIMICAIMPVAMFIYGINNTDQGYHNLKNQILVNVLLTTVISFIFGFFQWQILKPHITTSKKWLWTSFIGLSLGLFIALTENYSATDWEVIETNPLLLTAVTIGSTLGIVQWLSLRQHVKWASIWILTNILGWSIGLGWSWIFLPTNANDDVGFLSLALFLTYVFVTAITYSTFTGISLVWLLNHRSKGSQTTAA